MNWISLACLYFGIGLGTAARDWARYAPLEPHFMFWSRIKVIFFAVVFTAITAFLWPLEYLPRRRRKVQAGRKPGE